MKVKKGEKKKLMKGKEEKYFGIEEKKGKKKQKGKRE